MCYSGSGCQSREPSLDGLIRGFRALRSQEASARDPEQNPSHTCCPALVKSKPACPWKSARSFLGCPQQTTNGLPYARPLAWRTSPTCTLALKPCLRRYARNRWRATFWPSRRLQTGASAKTAKKHHRLSAAAGHLLFQDVHDHVTVVALIALDAISTPKVSTCGMRFMVPWVRPTRGGKIIAMRRSEGNPA